jgi:hypothetical protein
VMLRSLQCDRPLEVWAQGCRLLSSEQAMSIDTAMVGCVGGDVPGKV